MTDPEIGERIRVLRERAGISQAELGRRLGWARQTVSQVEAGERPLRWREMEVIARALETGVAELVA
jgi:transcriptional regulator with XRE-family HTH domain